MLICFTQKNFLLIKTLKEIKREIITMVKNMRRTLFKVGVNFNHLSQCLFLWVTDPCAKLSLPLSLNIIHSPLYLSFVYIVFFIGQNLCFKIILSAKNHMSYSLWIILPSQAQLFCQNTYRIVLEIIIKNTFKLKWEKIIIVKTLKICSNMETKSLVWR